jgi:hypothetical protein
LVHKILSTGLAQAVSTFVHGKNTHTDKGDDTMDSTYNEIAALIILFYAIFGTAFGTAFLAVAWHPWNTLSRSGKWWWISLWVSVPASWVWIGMSVLHMLSFWPWYISFMSSLIFLPAAVLQISVGRQKKMEVEKIIS